MEIFHCWDQTFDRVTHKTSLASTGAPCDIQVVDIPDASTQKRVYQSLFYKRKFLGRVVTENIPELGLPKNARLMPTSTLRDVGDFELTTPPFSTSWWVGPLDGRVLHDCPLMNVSGVGLEMWSLDIMHGWHLGPLQPLVSIAIHLCLESGLWAPQSPDYDAADRKRISLLAIKAELFGFYKLQRLDPEWVGKGSEETLHELQMVFDSINPQTEVSVLYFLF